MRVRRDVNFYECFDCRTATVLSDADAGKADAPNAGQRTAMSSRVRTWDDGLKRREGLCKSISVRVSPWDRSPISQTPGTLGLIARRQFDQLLPRIEPWRLEMKTRCTLWTYSTKSNRRTNRSIPFASTCPKCAQVRPQCGYDNNSLLRLLNGGYPVEAHCAICDEFWSISLKERAALGAAAIAAGGSLIC
jgi:hypothetical protein